jgi:cell division septation protein DedD
MDTAMRDLDQLRERGDDATGRKLGLFAMAGILSVAAVFAMGIMVGRGGSDEPGAATDPLAELSLPQAKAESAAAENPAANVRPEALSFPSTLVENQDDPAVEEAVRAAELELQALAGQPTRNRGAALDVPPIPAAPPPTVADLPAQSAASGEDAHLARVAAHDPLVARALPESEPAGNLAPQGRDGAYVLQVVSYEGASQAEKFANTLRARGHKAFVMAADVPGRGRFHRVRVGPFETRQEAASYQRTFEGSEHMHTILVANAQQ